MVRFYVGMGAHECWQAWRLGYVAGAGGCAGREISEEEGVMPLIPSSSVGFLVCVGCVLFVILILCSYC